MLPTALEIEGRVYKIDPSFENCSQILFAFEDPSIIEGVKPIILFNRLFLEEEPLLTEESYMVAVDFLDGPADSNLFNLPKNTKQKPRTFSFAQDFKFIISAISSTHSVNLRKESKTHWWVFLDMFLDLDSDCMFSQIISLRYNKNKGKLNKEEKKIWREMSDILVLRTPETIEARREAEEVENYLTYLESLSGGGSSLGK